jgi:DegV family protein with EDD domain
VPTALVTDSTAYLAPDVVARHGIRVVPLHVIVGGQEHAEGVDIGPGEVARALRSFTPVTTSRPSPQAFLDAYTAAAEAGADAVVSVHVSADMSSTVGSAHLAAARAPLPVTVVDSRVMGMAMGYAVLSGCEAAAGGADAATVAALVTRRCSRTTIVFYVDTLEYLRRGGRIGKANALLGSALAIKPILGMRDGHVVPVEELTAEAAEKAGEGVEVAVHHVDSAERAVRLADRLRGRLPVAREVSVVELGAVVGAHVGPGTLAVAVVPRA